VLKQHGIARQEQPALTHINVNLAKNCTKLFNKKLGNVANTNNIIIPSLITSPKADLRLKSYDCYWKDGSIINFSTIR